MAATISRNLADSDAWSPIVDGCRGMGHALGLLIPAFFLTPLSATEGTVAVVLVALHGWWQWFGLRDLRRGLATAVADDPMFAGRLTLAARASCAYVTIASALALLPLLHAIVGAAIPLPGGFQLAAMGIVTPFLVAALATGRWVFLALADACAVRDALPRLRAGSIGLLAVGTLVAMAWIAVALSLVLPSRLASPLFQLSLRPAVALGFPMLAVLWLQFDLLARLVVAVPRTPSFSAAARRVAEQARGPRAVPHDPRSDPNLAPIELAGEESRPAR